MYVLVEKEKRSRSKVQRDIYEFLIKLILASKAEYVMLEPLYTVFFGAVSAYVGNCFDLKITVTLYLS